ncbi:MAG: DNA repair protein [Sphaerochaeta sp.]|jgi:A/G-specific adenine glycosylase|nr:DNA repair protein [Sphaerochaeta sp.]MCI2076705.1 DNA repair protein [Sphaerochaeta sp.]MCI2097782.1 DNA repair protein [Sphaerochaeta sp.]MCI2105065.1 DNA repair protein [Sphaerochaeta sp.]
MTDFPDLSPEEAASYLDAPTDETEFVAFILHFYHQHGRSFPWRDTDDPYRVLLSEVMLQQTQTGRVEAKYAEFLALWPDFRALAEAPFPDLLTHWLGLGYNRRARALQQAAKATSAWGWTIPDDKEVILSLPGVGPSTASAIRCFCYHQPDIYLETNIRRVLLHVFHPGEEGVKDKVLSNLLASFFPSCGDPKPWYYALMDYGVLLKRLIPNPNRRSASYHTQSTFQGSDRQVRGALLHVLAETGERSLSQLESQLPFEPERVSSMLKRLSDEGLVAETECRYRINDI